VLLAPLALVWIWRTRGARTAATASAAFGAVLAVLAYRDVDGDVHGMTAWPATGRALRLYTDGRTS